MRALSPEPPLESRAPPSAAPPKHQERFAYHHSDSDVSVRELDEFFSYVEVPPVLSDCKATWEALSVDWYSSSTRQKESLVNSAAELFEHHYSATRIDAARRIAYIALGLPLNPSPDSPPSPEHHLCVLTRSCAFLRGLGILHASFSALQAAANRWTALNGRTEHSQLEDASTEIGLHLCILYFMVEVLRGDDTLADELMSFDPPVPVFLFNMVASLREVNAKGYPVKKLLLLLWKTMLVCFGGSKDLTRVKSLVREIEGLSNDDSDTSSPFDEQENDNPHTFNTRASLVDFCHFLSETTAKYPTYHAPTVDTPFPEISLDRIATAALPTPVKPSYLYSTAPDGYNEASSDSEHVPQDGDSQNGGPLPATPAPSPPNSPVKVKKSQFQTNQDRPYVMPFSTANAYDTAFSAVPRAVDEAGDLFRRNFRITTELWQTWKLREEFLEDEAGLREVNEPLAAGGSSTTADENFEDEHEGFVEQGYQPQEEERVDGLKMLFDLERRTREQANHSNDAKEKSLLLRKAVDVKRLQRVEIFYRSTVANLHSAIIVLLKLMLATVTATNSNKDEDKGNLKEQLSLETIDIMRHREITSKAVSAILIVLLRWFKASHVMKFHYCSLLLVDSNCLLLILRIFGPKDPSAVIRARHDVEEYDFFRWCYLTVTGQDVPSPEEYAQLSASKARQQALIDSNSPKDSGSPASPITSGAGHSNAPESPPIDTTDDSVEIKYRHDYSWRNFFSTVNFVHILQKLTKRRVQRTILMVHYKSAAILKRMLKVSHPLLQLYVLKVIRSQVPFSGRKWRQSSMKVITAIYLNCKPSLRNDWLSLSDPDEEYSSAAEHEQSLRKLVSFYNSKHYKAFAPFLHRRTSSIASERRVSMPQSGSAGITNDTSASASSGPPKEGSSSERMSNLPSTFDESSSATYGSSNNPSPIAYSSSSTSFPPARPISEFGADQHLRTAYIPDSVVDGYLENYEELLGDILTPHTGAVTSGKLPQFSHSSSIGGSARHGMPFVSTAPHAWERLGDIFGPMTDVSDSESVGSIGYLDISENGESEDDDSDEDEDGKECDHSEEDLTQNQFHHHLHHREKGKTDWEHLSPRTINALEEERAAYRRSSLSSPGSPLSPRPQDRRRSSSSDKSRGSPALRPVLPLSFDKSRNEDVSALDEVATEGEDLIDDDGQGDDDDDLDELGPVRTAPHTGPAVDEVEAIFGS